MADSPWPTTSSPPARPRQPFLVGGVRSARARRLRYSRTVTPMANGHDHAEPGMTPPARPAPFANTIWTRAPRARPRPTRPRGALGRYRADRIHRDKHGQQDRPVRIASTSRSTPPSWSRQGPTGQCRRTPAAAPPRRGRTSSRTADSRSANGAGRPHRRCDDADVEQPDRQDDVVIHGSAPSHRPGMRQSAHPGGRGAVAESI